MTTCPCCGFKFQGDLRAGCAACGARAVGDPLPKPDHELPAYGRPTLLVAAGILMLTGFLAQTVAALVISGASPFGFWSWVAAGETASWRLKWIAIPISLIVLIPGRRIYQSMLDNQSRFVGIKAARRGLTLAATVALLIATLIGVTVPARLEQRRLSHDAAQRVYGHTIARAQLEYRDRFGSIATSLTDLRRLPDADGTIAAALATVPNIDDPAGYSGYKPSTELAAVADKTGALRTTVIRKASLKTADDAPATAGVSYTNYELRLPGEDKIMFTDDDVIVTDGVVETVVEQKQRAAAAARKH